MNSDWLYADYKKIDIDTRRMPVYDVVGRMRQGDLVVDAELQQRLGQWPKERQSRLIESLIIGIPLPLFCFDASSVWDSRRWLVVDGMQRLATIRSFVASDDESEFRLSGLEYLKEFNGCCFADLPRGTQRQIEEAELQVAVIRPGTPKEICFEVVQRLNARGLSLNGQQIRHLLYRGEGTQFVVELAKYSPFRELLGRRLEASSMLDCELVSRFLALLVLEPEESFTSFDSFLNDALRVLNTMDPERLHELGNRFRLAVDRSAMLFGENAFKCYEPERNRFGLQLNKALFDALMIALSDVDDQAFCRMRDDPMFMDRYVKLFVDEGFAKGASLAASLSRAAGNYKALLTRLRILRNFMSYYE